MYHIYYTKQVFSYWDSSYFQSVPCGSMPSHCYCCFTSHLVLQGIHNHVACMSMGMSLIKLFEAIGPASYINYNFTYIAITSVASCKLLNLLCLARISDLEVCNCFKVMHKLLLQHVQYLIPVYKLDQWPAVAIINAWMPNLRCMVIVHYHIPWILQSFFFHISYYFQYRSLVLCCHDLTSFHYSLSVFYMNMYCIALPVSYCMD